MFHKLKSQGTLVNSTLNLTILNQNILYLTHEIDDIKRLLTRMNSDAILQTQVNGFYDKATSPQTDSEEQ